MKYYFICFFLCALFVASPSLADERPRSLFFTAEERASVADALVQKHRDNPMQAEETVHLGAILYAGPTQWTLWLQGEQWTPETVNEKIQVLVVTPEAVRLAVKADPESQPQQVTLHPNQTYRVSAGVVVEGE